MERATRTSWALVVGMLLLPALHPLLIPLIGVPSHLLWWVHVLPVALVAFHHGRAAAVATAAASTALLLAGERLFGSGYGVAASWETTWSLAIAVTATHILVAGFAIHARAESRQYRLLFDNAASAILRTDAQFRVRAANPAALRLFGCRSEDLLGRRLAQVEWLRGLPEPARLLASGWSGPISVGCGDEERIAHVAAAAAASHDPPGHQIIFVDRTSEVMQEKELERQARLATLGGTLAGVAHELKNPLQVINGFTELSLAPGSSEEEMREALETVRSQAQRMTTMVQELLGFSRSREDRSEVAVSELIGRIVRIHRLARGRSVQIRERTAWPGTIRSSAAKLEQIVGNLLSNAIDAVPSGSGVIEVSVERSGSHVHVVVADNGPGIDPSLGEHIFEPFVTTKGEHEGTGLGLAISRRLARALGGELTAAHRPERGARLTLRLPLEEPPETGPALATAALARYSIAGIPQESGTAR